MLGNHTNNNTAIMENDNNNQQQQQRNIIKINVALTELDQVNSIQKELERKYGVNHWRTITYHWLHSHFVIISLAALVLLDVLLIFISLTLETWSTPCPVILQRCYCSTNNKQPTLSPQCHEPSIHIENSLMALSCLSLIILMIFASELLIHFIVIGKEHFFSSTFLIMDLLVVLVSIGLESYVIFVESQHESTDDAIEVAMIVLIISRVWRIVRIGHSSYRETHEYYGMSIYKTKKQYIYIYILYTVRLTHNNNQAEKIIELEREIRRLKNQQPTTTTTTTNNNNNTSLAFT
jgi:hypothetical protein